jgi:hypothetical protein
MHWSCASSDRAPAFQAQRLEFKSQSHKKKKKERKKEKILSFATTWMNLVDIMLSKISHTQKDKYHIISHMWNFRKLNSREVE